MAELIYDDAAHLLRRMGFGGNPTEIGDLVSRGREGAVDYLLNYGSINNQQMNDLLNTSFDFSNPQDNQKFNRGEIQRWWLTRMAHTRRQFEEKMTLFWHNHFATAFSKVPDPFMFVQNLTLRNNALDRFDDLLLKVAQDPAMLIWLDGVVNVVGKPNENWARELQELFTTGINDLLTGETNYTEDDVKEISRAFTGWSFRRDRTNPLGYQFVVIPNLHDNSNKTVFKDTPYERSGNLSGEDIITILCDRPQTGYFLVKRLFTFFVYPLTSSSADKQTIAKFAAVYQSSDHSIKELLRAIFTSNEFFSDRARFGLVKHPVEFIVGALRMIGGQYNPGTWERRQTSNILAFYSRAMGQELFNPPDVAGWDLNLGWVNTSFLLERYNYANVLCSNRATTSPGISVTHQQLASLSKPNAKKTVKSFLKTLGPLQVDKKTKKTLQGYLKTDDQGNAAEFQPTDQLIDKKVRGLVHQIMSMPEFQQN